MELQDGAVLGYGEAERISAALAALKKDVHAPREITVKLTLGIHREYPKHITVDGKSVLVNNAAEERAASKGE